MALVQPSFILPPSALIKDETLTYKFNFGIGNTDIVQSTKINIYDSPNATTPVATSIYNSTLNEHQIAPSVTEDLTVQQRYYLTIQTYSQANAMGTESVESPRVTVWCLNLPTLTINTPQPNEHLKVSGFAAEATYNTQITDPQLGVENTLQQYRFDLMQGGAVIYTSDNIVGEGTPLSGEFTNTEYSISYNFPSVSNGIYTLLITCITTESITLTASVLFNVDVDITEFKTAQVSNNVCEGYINIECNITNIEGETNATVHPESWVQLVGLPNDIEGYVKWSHGYNYPQNIINGQTFSNWTLQLWGFDFSQAPYTSLQLDSNNSNTNTNYLVQIRGYQYENNDLDGEIDIYIVKVDDTNIQAEMHVYPYAPNDYTISQTIHSNTIPIPTNGTDLTDSDLLSLWVRSVNGYYEVFLRNITQSTPPIPATLNEDGETV